MESPSAPPHRWCIPWQRLLLTASLLTFWNPPTTAQLTIESTPFSVAEGKEVLLLVHNLPQNRIGYTWYKGERVDGNHLIVAYAIRTAQATPGPAYSSRETVYPNASLLIQNVTQNDTGFYTLQVINSDLVNEEATGRFRVYPELPKPSITSNNSNPVEDKDAVALTCEPGTQDTTYLWWVNNQSLPVSPRLQLSNGNRTLTLFNVTRNDTAIYQCETQNPVSARHSDAVILNVLYGPDAPTISPLNTSYRSGENLNLSCHAASNPPAQYSWFVNGTFQQSTQELFIPNITVNNSGSYACQAHNSATGLNRTTVTTITVSAQPPKPFITSNNSNPVEDEDAVALTCEPEIQNTTYLWWVNNQSLPVSPRLQLSNDNRTLTLLSVTRNDVGPYECGIQNELSVDRSDPVTLNVLYGPDGPTISPSYTYYRPGVSLSLSCHAASNPPAQYSWLIDGNLQQYTQELFISNITEKNSGPYTCHANNPASGHNRTAVKTITVSAELPKPNITSSNSNPIEDKDAVVLTCEPEAQDTTYLWWVNNQSLPVSPRLQLSNGNRTLTLLSVTRNDAGAYECEIQNSVSANFSDPVILNVFYGPDTPIISPPDSSYHSGANLSLSCHSASNPSPKYSWRINGIPQQHTQVLFISQITSNNNGAYACFVSNLATGRNNSIVKSITVSDDSASGSSPGLSAGATVGIMIGVLVGVALI
ncbi:carcinoembryonic antigen-related cell adhesion molecule 5 isoform X2 [Symphalangus syndactylus]|uniref:carcinoembryonic antigen-related cell adhesion molecule 5 isoform X2 n=1 Tax=Symphalangus syndactylus TaxID=9590 RepID=UPI0024434DA9|nr:carcinoembryonic antigen-related cell adhesion molecule 5 isoform X1 [Symphalangus syndactylus]XP_055106303.1 carcinoembryonic antigen-related cell adhesion molecule 5 isoform X2 [Symphalangus syndactylus]